MKYIVMAVLLMAGAAAYAQEPLKEQNLKTPTERLTPAQKAYSLTTTLGLTADQQAKVKGLYEEQEKTSNDLKEKYKTQKDDAARKARIQALKDNREQFKTKMKEILTPEQYTKFQSLKENSRPEGLKPGAMETKKLQPATFPAGN